MIWKLNVFTIEEAKEKILKSPVWGDVYFVGNEAYHGQKQVGELEQQPDGEYWFIT